MIYRQRRTGTTLVEQLVVLSLLGTLLAISVAGGARLLDHAAVYAASRDVRDLLALARDQAAASGARVAVRLEETPSRVVVHRGADTIALSDLARSAVQLTATRDSMAYGPSGLGVGAANVRLVLTRGSAYDTITVSRLGRVR